MTAPQERTVAEVLRAAADLLETKGWTQGAFARGPNGRMTHTMAENAQCFCLRGALVRVGAVDAWEEENAATLALGFRTAASMTKWNDRKTRTKDQVLARVHEAAALAEVGQ